MVTLLRIWDLLYPLFSYGLVSLVSLVGALVSTTGVLDAGHLIVYVYRASALDVVTVGGYAYIYLLRYVQFEYLFKV